MMKHYYSVYEQLYAMGDVRFAIILLCVLEDLLQNQSDNYCVCVVDVIVI